MIDVNPVISKQLAKGRGSSCMIGVPIQLTNLGDKKIMMKSDILRQELDEFGTSLMNLAHQIDASGKCSAGDEEKLKEGIAKMEEMSTEIRRAQKVEETIRLTRATEAALMTPKKPFCFNNDGTEYDGRDEVQVVRPTLRAFRGNGNRDQAARDAYDCGLWLQAHVTGNGDARAKLESRRGATWLASQNESSATAGGYLVPSELSSAVIVSRQEVGAMRKLARIIPMGSEVLQIPKQSDGTTVYYPGEEGSITASDLDFGRVNLVAKKRAIYALFSNELRDDAVAVMADLLMSDMGHQFAAKEDAEGILGDGTSSYGGVAGIKHHMALATAGIATAATNHDTWPELDFSDFAAVMGKLPAKYRAGNDLAWLCSPSFKWAVMDRLAIGANGALSQSIVDGQPQDRFLGYPVVLSDNCETATAAATVCCYFGNWKRAVVLGDRSEVRIATSEHIAFQTDQTAIRGTVRYDIQVHEAGNASTAGAIVALKTAS